METKEYKNDYFDRVEALGQARGEALGEARALLKVIRSRKIALTGEQEERIASCPDSGQVDRWLDNALAATTAEEVFKD